MQRFAERLVAAFMLVQFVPFALSLRFAICVACVYHVAMLYCLFHALRALYVA